MVSERWQQEVAETVFEAINQETDKIEQKRRQKPRTDDIDIGIGFIWKTVFVLPCRHFANGYHLANWANKISFWQII